MAARAFPSVFYRLERVRTRMPEWGRLQGLELLVTALLARNRPNPAARRRAKFAAGLVSLPSGLLAMVCEAIVRLKVRLAAALRAAPRAARAYDRRVGNSTGPDALQVSEVGPRRSHRLSSLRARAGSVVGTSKYFNSQDY
jgi:hypothetical protein